MTNNRYSSREMRKAATTLYKRGDNLMTEEMLAFSAMLRQAADAEEANAKLREENAKLTNIINTECNKCGDCAKFGNDCTAGDVDGNEDCRACDRFVPKELAQLKARLEAVVEECEAIKSHYEKVVLSQLPVTLVVEANRILRVARGEGGAE